MATQVDSQTAILNALNTSDLGQCLSENLSSIIMQYLTVTDIYFCSHNGCDIIAYSIHGDYMGTIVKTVADEDAQDHEQWLTGFDFDSKGTLYVALRIGIIGKYKIPAGQTPFSTKIIPREKDESFDSNFQESLRKWLRESNVHELCVYDDQMY